LQRKQLWFIPRYHLNTHIEWLRTTY
jgi:hypothetical protein